MGGPAKAARRRRGRMPDLRTVAAERRVTVATGAQPVGGGVVVCAEPRQGRLRPQALPRGGRGWLAGRGGSEESSLHGGKPRGGGRAARGHWGVVW